LAEGRLGKWSPDWGFRRLLIVTARPSIRDRFPRADISGPPDGDRPVAGLAGAWWVVIARDISASDRWSSLDGSFKDFELLQSPRRTRGVCSLPDLLRQCGLMTSTGVLARWTYTFGGCAAERGHGPPGTIATCAQVGTSATGHHAPPWQISRGKRWFSGRFSNPRRPRVSPGGEPSQTAVHPPMRLVRYRICALWSLPLRPSREGMQVTASYGFFARWNGGKRRGRPKESACGPRLSSFLRGPSLGSLVHVRDDGGLLADVVLARVGSLGRTCGHDVAGKGCPASRGWRHGRRERDGRFVGWVVLPSMAERDGFVG